MGSEPASRVRRERAEPSPLEPLQEVPPARGDFRYAVGDGMRREIRGASRLPDELQSGLLRGLSPFLPVALDAAGDDVLPVLAPSLGCRGDVIERQLRGRESIPAILALIAIAKINVRSGERDLVQPTGHAGAAQEPQDRGKLEGNRDPSDPPIVRGDDLDLLLHHEDDGLLPSDDPERLVAGIEQKATLHGKPPRTPERHPR